MGHNLALPIPYYMNMSKELQKGGDNKYDSKQSGRDGFKTQRRKCQVVRSSLIGRMDRTIYD